MGERPVKIDWLTVLRDILMVVVLGALGTLGISMFLIGSAQWTQYLTVFVLLTIGFAISGALKGAGRFKHLPIVALGVWCVNMLDSAVREPERLPATASAIAIVFVAMLTGGLVSFAIKRPGAAPAARAD
jgi:hypothetical protein